MSLKTVLGAAVLAICSTGWAADYYNILDFGEIPPNHFILTDQTACDAGYVEVTAYQGYALWAQAAAGTAGATLGTGRASNTTDLTITATSSTPTFTGDALTTTNLTVAAGTTPIVDDTTVTGTVSTPTITVAAAADTRGELVPSVSLRLCKKP